MNIYVNPRENGTCCEENGICQSLNLALECLQQHNQTTVWIEPGLYYLTATVDAANSTAYEFHWMQDIAMVALSDAPNSTDGNEIPVQVICRDISTDNGAGMTFINSTNVTIRGIMFDQCGVYQHSTSHTVDGSDFFQFFAAIYFMLCRDITLEYVHVNGTKGIGAVFYSTVGLNRIQQCNFSHNAVESEGTIPGGGGVYIEFSYCLPMAGNLNICDNDTNVPSFNTDNAQYLIEFTTFYKNNATVTNATDLTFILPHRSDHVAFGRGGGLSVFFKGNAFNDTVAVRNCSFIANQAMWGAGLFVEYQDNAQNNVFEISFSHLDSNVCHNSESESKGTGGGGARIGYIFFDDSYGNVSNNTMIFDDIEFTGNKAYYGGGLSFYTAREKASASPTNRLSFKNCLWQRNTARVGSGADISVWHPIPSGAVVEPSFTNCTFYNNSAQYTPNLGSQVGVGALYIDSVPVTFSGAVWFIANTQTALAAISTGLYFDRGCRAHFSSNQGRNGGAIALLGDAFIRVSNLTRMFFLNNTAELKGGAIYGHSIGEHDLISSRNCFIRYEDVQATPLNWTAKFSFENNTLFDGSSNSIYVTSLLTCLWGGAFGSTESIQDAADRVFCWGDQWKYAGNCSDEISTSPASFSPDLREDSSTMELDDDNTTRHDAMMKIYAIPGMRTKIDISTFDDRGNNVTNQTVFTASMKDNSNVNISLDSSFLYISDNKFELYGEPESTGMLKLETIDPRVISTQINVILQQCPPGLVKGDEGASASCLCAGDYGGYIVCNGSTFSAKILRGSWIGRHIKQGTDTWIVGQCPYCSSFGSELLIQLPQNASKLSQCAQVNRRGELCGRCIEGYGPVVNGDFQCVDCSSSVTKYHWFFYLLTEFLPIVIFFFIVVFLNVSATSGPANAFVFFAQVITTAFTVTGDGVIQIKSLANTTTAHALKDLYTIPYEIWNLNFFHPFLPKFCLSSKITTLQLLSTGYITALFPLLLVVTFYLFVYLYSRGVKPIVCLCRPLHHCFARFRGIIWNFERSVLHALATFLLLSYTKFSLVSFILLTPTPLLKNTGEKDRFVLYYDGTIDFFSKDHAPYIIVSAIVLLTFVLLPPFVLMLPSMSHLVRLCLQKAFNYEGNLLSYQVGSVTGQFMTAFYECYKDGTGDPSGQTDNNNQDFRWFAGMYFIFRLMVFATFAFTPDWFMQYVILQFICICGLLSFSLLRPYKNDWYNRLDATIFAILSAINSLSMYNYFLAVLDKSPSVWVFSIQYLFIMCPLVYMVIFILQYLIRKYREKAVRCFKRTWPFSKHFVGDGDEGNEDFLEYTQGTGRLEGDLEYSINIADARNRQRSMQEELNHHFGSETQALLLEDPAQEAPAEENPGNSNSGSSGYGATGSGSAAEDSLTPSENSAKSDSKAQFYQYGVEKLLFEEPPTDQKDKRRRLFRTK
jgi:predicted outer membrane repeat protein